MEVSWKLIAFILVCTIPIALASYRSLRTGGPIEAVIGFAILMAWLIVLIAAIANLRGTT